jgi:tetratricopeptide (TPR) repeat protein
VSGFPFVRFDDPSYVYENPDVSAGLTRAGVAWAFTTYHAANWHPLTWISHMLDVTLFGLDAGRHHLVNVLLHLCATLLLFRLLRKLTGAPWRSGIVAALFAVHPLHVESVAWVSERKDVLCAVFFLWTVRAYVGFRERPGPLRYAAVLLPFALALMAKPMAVTLPFVLLLVDWWPLGRFGGEGRLDAARRFASACLEKLPMFVLSAASCLLTLKAQSGGGAVSGQAALALSPRLANAALAYAWYLWKAAVPTGLAVFYPHPAGAVPAGAAWGAAAFLAGATAAAWQARRHPWLLFGWLWFLGTLVPVIGLVQVGTQGMADRYGYLPLVGIFVAATWGIAEAAARPRFRWAACAAAGLVILAFGVTARAQVGYWKDSGALFGRALEASPNEGSMHILRGEYFASLGRLRQAEDDFRRGLAARPDLPEGHAAYGLFLDRNGRSREAIFHIREAIRLARADPDGRPVAEGYFSLGRAALRAGDPEAAEDAFRETIRLKPDHAEAHNNLGVALVRQRRTAEAIAAFRETLRLKPDHAGAARNLALASADGAAGNVRP